MATTRPRSVSSSSYSSYTSESDSDDERYYGNAGYYNANTVNANTYANSGAYTTTTASTLPTQVYHTTETSSALPTQVIGTSSVLPTQVIGTGYQQPYVTEIVPSNIDINHSQIPLATNHVLPSTTTHTVESYSKGPTLMHPVGQSTTVVTSETLPTNVVPVHTENVALAQAGVEERLKGRGSRIRNKIRLRRNRNKNLTTVDPVTGLATGLGAMELVDRSKFNGYGPVDQLDQKLAGRNAIDNAIADTKGNPDFNVGGYPAVESYRQNPDGIMRHKFTGQTHFDTENASTGPGFTNGDFYDKPGYAGTKYGQAKHQGPIDALAQKIVGHHYTTHEPMMDKIYVEPHQKGPIDALAHLLTGGHHPVIADSVGTTGIATTGAVGTTGAIGTGVVAPTGMQRLRNKLHRHHRHKKAGVVAGDPYYREGVTGQRLPKEMGEGPLDALGHKLTLSFHDPLHTKTAGHLHNEIIPAGVVNATHGQQNFVATTTTTTAAEPIVHTQKTTVVQEGHVGMVQKLKNKLHIE